MVAQEVDQPMAQESTVFGGSIAQRSKIIFLKKIRNLECLEILKTTEMFDIWVLHLVCMKSVRDRAE